MWYRCKHSALRYFRRDDRGVVRAGDGEDGRDGGEGTGEREEGRDWGDGVGVREQRGNYEEVTADRGAPSAKRPRLRKV